jgi:hypothetical protein
MKRKTLLILGMFIAFLVGHAQTQVFYNGFEEVQGTDTTTVGWFQFINNQTGDTRDSVYSGMQYAGKNSCWFHNDAATSGQQWFRSIKFRNLPLKANTSYRLSFYLKGDNQYTADGTNTATKVRASVMTGEENADVQLLAIDSTKFDYTANVSNDWKKYTYMFYYSGYDIQAEYFANHKSATSPDSVLANKCFAAIYMYNPGDYYLDEVNMQESEIGGIAFSADAIKVNFGYDTNISTLAKTTTNGKLQIGSDCVKVNLNGKDVEITSVELWKDSCMYIFLGDEYPQSADDKVLVSFTNPTGSNQLKYTGKLRPRSFEANDDSLVRAFTNEAGEYDENLSATSAAYDPPTLASSDPEDGSFDLPTTMNTFTLKFDKLVDVSKLSATLTGGKIKGENLTIEPTSGYAQSITLTRTGTTELTTDEYTINLPKVIGKLSYGDDIYNTVNLTLNFGTKTADPNDTAYVAWTDSFSVLGANYIPAQGWTFVNNGTEMTGGASAGSGPRTFKYSDGSDFIYGMYIRCGTAEYGLNEDHPLTLKAGKYQIHYNHLAWKSTPYLKFEILDAADNVLYTETDASTPNVNGSTAKVTTTASVTVDFKAPTDGNYKLKWTTCDNTGTANTSGMQEIMFGNVYVKYIPSTPGAYYKTMLANALATAKTAQTNNTGTRYSGTAFTNLSDLITKYDGKAFTAPSTYTTATTELTSATTKMTAHRTLIDTYDPLVSSAETVIATYADTKYANDASYPALQKVINIYKGQVLMQDDSLQTAIDSLQFHTSLCSNMCQYVISDLTKRLSYGITLAEKIGISSDDPVITAAQNAITDDDNIAKNLKDAIKKKLYENLGSTNDTTFSIKTDPNTLETYVDSLNMSVFIKNPELYVVNTATGNKDMTACPGWTFTDISSTGYDLSWGTAWSYVISNTRPAANAQLSSWSKSFNMHQDITDLPSGVYSIRIGASERFDYTDATNNRNGIPYSDWFYVKTTNGMDSIRITKASSQIPENNLSIDNITVTDGKLTIGAKDSIECFPTVEGFSLYMKAKAPNFDYATDIKGINDVSNATLKSVDYYDINGRKISKQTRGITIIKWNYSDGSSVLNKKITK